MTPATSSRIPTPTRTRSPRPPGRLPKRRNGKSGRERRLRTRRRRGAARRRARARSLRRRAKWPNRKRTRARRTRGSCPGPWFPAQMIRIRWEEWISCIKLHRKKDIYMVYVGNINGNKRKLFFGVHTRLSLAISKALCLGFFLRFKLSPIHLKAMLLCRPISVVSAIMST